MLLFSKIFLHFFSIFCKKGAFFFDLTNSMFLFSFLFFDENKKFEVEKTLSVL